MADNLDFSSARFATASMMPVGIEEANALWCRKVVESAARAVGAWGTVVVPKTAQYELSGDVDFSGEGFNTVPSVDIYHLRGGSNPTPLTQYRMEAGQPLGQYMNILSQTMHLFVRGDAGGYGERAGSLLDFDNYATSVKDFGTFIYRLRGW
jgi:hypothetical protein